MKKSLSLVIAAMLLIGMFAGCAPAAKQEAAAPAANQAPATEEKAPEAKTEEPAAAEVVEGDHSIAPPSGYTPDSVVPNRKYRIAMSGAKETDANTTLVVEQMKLAAQYYGVELLTAYNNGDPVKVANNVENAISWGAEYYINYNEDAEANKRAGERLKEVGIPGLAIQVTMGDDYPFYHMDNAKAGQIDGAALAEQGRLKFGDDVPVDSLLLIVMGYPEGGALFQLRADEVRKAVEAEFPGIKVVEYSSEANAEAARQKTADALTANPGKKILLWGHHDQFTLAALSALEADGRLHDSVVTSIVGLELIFPELMKNDPVYGTISIMTVQWAWDILPRVIRELNGEKDLPMDIGTPLILLTGENLGEYFPEWVAEYEKNK